MDGSELIIETGNSELFVDNKISIDKRKFIAIWKTMNGKCTETFGIQTHPLNQQINQ